MQLWACTGNGNQQWDTNSFRIHYDNPAATGEVLNDAGYGGNGTRQRGLDQQRHNQPALGNLLSPGPRPVAPRLLSDVDAPVLGGRPDRAEPGDGARSKPITR